MKSVAFIFVTGTSWMDSLVTTVTKSRWSHVVLRFEEDILLVEALAGRGFIVQSGNKYDGWEPSLTVTKQVPAAAYDKMLESSRQWATENTPYGYRTCVAIGVKELCGERAGLLALKWLTAGRANSLVCSELMVMLWRIAYPDFLPGRESRLVSPDELYKALNEKFS
jgi:hypothetical protein